MKRVNGQALLVAVFLGLAGGLTGCEKPLEPVREDIKPIKIFTVGDSPLASGKEFPGRVEASQGADLSFRIPGRLVEFPVKQGESVKAGQLLARLDKRDLETREASTLSQLDQARAQLQQMRTGARPEDIARMQAAVSARDSEYQEAKKQFDRYTQLKNEGIVSPQDYDRTKAAVDTARAALETARQELAIGRKGAREEEIAAQEAVIRGLEAGLKEVRDAISDTEMTAPFDGVVARTDAAVPDDLPAGKPILTLQDISSVDIVLNLSEKDMVSGTRSIKKNPSPDPGRVVGEASFPALGPEAYPVRLKEIQTEASPDTQTFEVILQMVQPEGNPVKPGMNAVVRGGAAGGTNETVPYIPLSAVAGGAEGTGNVWVVSPDTMTVSARAIETGEIAGDRIQVPKGLSGGGNDRGVGGHPAAGGDARGADAGLGEPLT